MMRERKTAKETDREERKKETSTPGAGGFVSLLQLSWLEIAVTPARSSQDTVTLVSFFLPFIHTHNTV